MRVIKVLAIAAILLGNATGTVVAKDKRAAQAPLVAVGPQYDSTHVYVAPADLESFTSSLVATFGGTKSQPATITVTPTPSETTFEFVFTPIGTFSVFGFKTPIPYPFGSERTGYLVKDFDAGNTKSGNTTSGNTTSGTTTSGTTTSGTTTTPARPAILSNRWEEDWSVLANPRVPRQPFDCLKYIPLSPDDPKTYLSFGADIRERFEANDVANFGVSPNRNNDYLLSRIDVFADLRIANQVQVFTQ